MQSLLNAWTNYSFYWNRLSGWDWERSSLGGRATASMSFHTANHCCSHCSHLCLRNWATASTPQCLSTLPHAMHSNHCCSHCSQCEHHIYVWEIEQQLQCHNLVTVFTVHLCPKQCTISYATFQVWINVWCLEQPLNCDCSSQPAPTLSNHIYPLCWHRRRFARQLFPFQVTLLTKFNQRHNAVCLLLVKLNILVNTW